MAALPNFPSFDLELGDLSKAWGKYDVTPQKNIEYVVYEFCQVKQLPGEYITTYYTRLKQLARSCDFYDKKREIKNPNYPKWYLIEVKKESLIRP